MDTWCQSVGVTRAEALFLVDGVELDPRLTLGVLARSPHVLIPVGIVAVPRNVDTPSQPPVAVEAPADMASSDDEETIAAILTYASSRHADATAQGLTSETADASAQGSTSECPTGES